MKKAAFAMSILFMILTFCGAGYVLYHHGEVNAGYAVIPMLFALAGIAFTAETTENKLPDKR